jgi:chromosome partitioning protein
LASKNLTLAFASSKGGAGKSTLACSLAAELRQRGRSVTLIDADPQGGTSAWHAAGGPLSGIPLIADSSTRVTATARKAAADGPVIIDAAGFATSTLVAVLEAADIVLIPCRASSLDALRAIETARLAAEVSKARRKRVPVLAVLNAVTNAAIVPHIRQELEAAGVRVAATEVRHRTAFAVAALSGTAPCWMGSSAAKAAQEIAALADEIGADEFARFGQAGRFDDGIYPKI